MITMTEETAAQPVAQTQIIQRKHPLAIRWFHWINFPVLFLMIWSGLMIYWANRVFHIRLFGHDIGPLFPDSWYAPIAPSWVPHWLLTPGVDDNSVPHLYLWDLSSRLAEGMAWHFTFAWIFAINGIIYFLYLIFS